MNNVMSADAARGFLLGLHEGERVTLALRNANGPVLRRESSGKALELGGFLEAAADGTVPINPENFWKMLECIELLNIGLATAGFGLVLSEAVTATRGRLEELEIVLSGTDGISTNIMCELLLQLTHVHFRAAYLNGRPPFSLPLLSASAHPS